MPIRARLEDMDLTLEQAAADLYATPWQAFRRMTLPLLMPGILSGAALAFIVSLDDFTITQLVAGPGQTTLPLYIWDQITRGHDAGDQRHLDHPAAGFGPVRLVSFLDRAQRARAEIMGSQQENRNDHETDGSPWRRQLLLLRHVPALRRRRAAHLQLGRLHQPRPDQEVREALQRQGHARRLRFQRHDAAKVAPAAPATTSSVPSDYT